MIDLVKLALKAGNGGNGRVAFRREKYVSKGGPNGGQGGNGGSIILRANARMNTLGHLAGVKEIIAQVGQAGGKSQLTGRAGEHTIIEVPVGTIVWQLERNTVARRREYGSRWDDRVAQIKAAARIQDEVDDEDEAIDEDLLDEGEDDDSEVNQNDENNQNEENEEQQPIIVEDKEIELRRPLKRSFAKFSFYELEKETERVPMQRPDEISHVENFSLKNVDLKQVEKAKLISMDTDGQEFVLCQGGFGGRGNESFKGPARTTPMLAEYGTYGEQRLVMLELQLFADVGLVGLPNAGKSTFLSRVTKANPRIEAYPFTTLEPQLGIWKGKDGGEIVVADIPGLIEGASMGKGLGYTFLRHIRACRKLLFFLTPSEDTFGQLQSGQVSAAQLVDELEAQFKVLLDELAAFDAVLLEKDRVVCFNKIDLLPQEILDEISKILKKRKLDWRLVSTFTGDGLVDLHDLLV